MYRGFDQRIGAKQATDSDGARNLLIESLGGIPIGRRPPRARSSQRQLSPRLSLRRAKTASPEPTRANSLDPRSGRNVKDLRGKSKCPRGGFPFSKPPYAALWKSSIWRIQLVSGFHLGQIWATISKSLILNG